MDGYSGGDPGSHSRGTSQPVAAKANADSGNGVRIGGMRFQPATVKVTAGETVTWTNSDGMPHTVTAISGGAFRSSRLSRAGSFSHTFDQPSTYEYYCELHPSMRGTVVVE